MFANTIENKKGILNIDKSRLFETVVHEFAMFDSCRYFFYLLHSQYSKDDNSNNYVTLTIDSKLYP
jgi:hypothetical protein